MSLLDIQCIIIFMINVWCFMIIDFLSISWTYKHFLIFCKVLRISDTLYLKKKIYYYCVGVWFDHIHILVNFFNFLLFLNCVWLLTIKALYIHVHNITLSVKCAREESWKHWIKTLFKLTQLKWIYLPKCLCYFWHTCIL